MPAPVKNFAKNIFLPIFAPCVCGRVVIGSQARLRIWCRKAYGFESLRPHEASANQLISRGLIFYAPIILTILKFGLLLRLVRQVAMSFYFI